VNTSFRLPFKNFNLCNIGQLSRPCRLQTPCEFAASAAKPHGLSRKPTAKEIAMLTLTTVLFLAGAFVLILCVGLAVRAFLGNRRAKWTPFRDYFGPEYDRDLLQQSAFSETEDWLADRQARFAPFRRRDPEESERR
jgi:hypothetical protein